LLERLSRITGRKHDFNWGGGKKMNEGAASSTACWSTRILEEGEGYEKKKRSRPRGRRSKSEEVEDGQIFARTGFLFAEGEECVTG